MAKSALVALGILPDGTKAAAHLRRPLRPRLRFASGEHAPATALAASQPLHEGGDRRVGRDGEARQYHAGQQPDVSATKALNGHCRLTAQRSLGHTRKDRKVVAAFRADP
jgi:hypothetical protein